MKKKPFCEVFFFTFLILPNLKLVQASGRGGSQRESAGLQPGLNLRTLVVLSNYGQKVTSWTPGGGEDPRDPDWKKFPLPIGADGGMWFSTFFYANFGLKKPKKNA